jgi:DNA-binding MarR family transcriptional regulator
MQHLLIKELPKYECLAQSAQSFPEMDPLATAVVLHLLRTGDEVFRAISETFKAYQLTQGRIMVLLHLFDKVGCCSQTLTPADIADRACVTRATVTGLLDGLQRDDFITRTPSAHDRRMIMVQLTDKGINLIQEVLPRYYQQVALLMKQLSDDERHQLIHLLERVCACIQEVCPTPGAT